MPLLYLSEADRLIVSLSSDNPPLLNKLMGQIDVSKLLMALSSDVLEMGFKSF